MGRKRKSPQIVLLRVFDSDTKLTEEQKTWLLNNRKVNNSKKGDMYGKSILERGTIR